MQKINREDVVQAALMIYRYCSKNYGSCESNCPFYYRERGCALDISCSPWCWDIEDFLRNRGLENG
ncbi:MAG: hypothetical protein IIX02_05390 [Clostridia bacterium]|nr:hypothetical protein [Clostridia bacterium]